MDTGSRSGIELDRLFAAQAMHRRDFLRRIGGGIAILFTVGLPTTDAQGQRRRRGYPEDLNAYLRIGQDGLISCFTGKIEMGQGIIISLAQMLADELDVALDRVKMVMGDTVLCPYDGGTTGSRTTKYFGPALRRAGAEARHVLMQLAAEKINVPLDRLVAKDGVISDTQDAARNVSYAQLAKGQAIVRAVDGEIAPEHYSRHTVAGKATRRTDAREKLTGAAPFAGDIRLPGMLYAKVVRPPAHGARLKTADTRAAKQTPGVIVVEEADLVAVLHEKPDVAEMALAKIVVEFDTPDASLGNETIFDHLEKSGSSERVVTEKGDLAEGRGACEKSFETTFYNHYVAHAPIEPHTVLVDVGDEVRVWASTQTPFRVRTTVAEALDVPEEKVRVITPFVGGGFGGKKSGLFITQAAQLARITGRPVQVALSRKEEFFYDTFRPAAVIQARSGIDGAGRICFWDFAHFFPGTRSSEPIYDIPHYRVVSRRTARGEPNAHPFGTGAWRGPGSNSNVHAMESQTDIMAQAAGMDPLSFRLKNLSDKRMVRVLEAAAETFDRTFSKGPSGKGYGIACTDYLNTYVAIIAEVKVNRQTGNVQVERIVCAQDMGEVINPQGAVLQVEGGVTMGLGYCLGEEIHFRGGQVLTENFDTYEIARFSWAPQIDAVLIDNPDLAPQGCGEPAITTMGGVIANAVYDAIGVRLFMLPMTPERVKAAVQEG